MTQTTDGRAAPRRTTDSPLARMRMEKGVTQAQLAERIGCLQSSVSRWEQTGKAPGTRYLVKIAEVLECDLKDLI